MSAIISKQLLAESQRRNYRDRFAGATFVLDRIDTPAPLPKGDAILSADVAAFLGVAVTTLRGAIDKHPAEMSADGYSMPGRGYKATYSRRTVVRMALSMRWQTSQQVEQIQKLVADLAAPARVPDEQRPAPEHVAECVETLRGAFSLVEDVRDRDPADVWTGLGKLGAHRLQAVAVALAALVPIDLGTRQLQRWLADVPGVDGNVAEALAKLVPALAAEVAA